MSLILLNLQSNQEITLEKENPFIIGRNNVNGCFDKRVSRSHGKITWTVDGKIHLVALHSNPCFFTRNGTPPVLQLIKNEEEFLKEGDCIGLLPDSFWFQIKKNKEQKIENNFKKESKKEFKLGNNKTQEFHIENTKESIQHNDFQSNEILEQNVNFNTSHSSSDLNNQPLQLNASDSDFEVKLESSPNAFSSKGRLGNPEFEKTRRLPLWMYQIEEPIKNNPNIEVTFRSRFANSKEAEPSYKKAKLESEQDELTLKSTAFTLPSKVKQDSFLESGISLASGQNKCSPSKKTSASKVKTPEKNFESYDEYSKLENKDCKTVENVPVKDVPKRPICLYESNCYRKKPQHKLDFCHPGDEDYIPYENRPLCQYGESCYRQNKMHKVEFRHSPTVSNSQNSSSSSSHCSSPRPGEERPPCLYGSRCYRVNLNHRKRYYHPPKGYHCYFQLENSKFDKCNCCDIYCCDDSKCNLSPSSPLPPKRQRKTVNWVTIDDNEDYNEYDLEDPFINDASSDDYVPSEMDEEEMEIVEDTD